MSGDNRISPVILSGGAGTRLWPLSRELYPKQFFPLASPHSLLQDTARRVSDPARFSPPLVVCNDEHRFVVAEQLREIGVAPRDILLEPAARNTAAAIAVAALVLCRDAGDDGDPVLLVLPSDHVIADERAFHAALARALPAARAGALVTFGITPTRPETGFGYIRQGAPLSHEGRILEGCFAAARFVEKPDAAIAARMLAEGGWLWNSGMFLFSAARVAAEIEMHQPAIARACRDAVAGAKRDLDFFRLERQAFAAAPALSFDHAVMERTDRAAVVPADFGWSDVGSWTALWEAEQKKDAGDNVLKGDVVVDDVHGCYIRTDDRLVAVIGLRDMALIVTDDAVLAAPRGRAQEVKALVAKLRAAGRGEALQHSRVYRPWGFYQTVDKSEMLEKGQAADKSDRSLDKRNHFQVKRITVKPGGRLSLQRHRHRAEHWVVVEGTARVTRGEEIFLLHENESTFIPAGTLHRLENAGETPLNLIEVQSGAYLGEDDIERLEDSYGRS